MKLQILAAALAGLVAAPAAMAVEPEALTLNEVSELTGVSTSALRVLVGAQSTPGKYPLNYYAAKRHYERAMEQVREQGFALEGAGKDARLVRDSGAGLAIAAPGRAL